MNEMSTIAINRITPSLRPDYWAQRPWQRNFLIEPAAMSVAVNKIVKKFNKGRGVFAHAGMLGRNCRGMTVSPVGAVKKGDELLSENVRIILGLSSPKFNSINSNTTNEVPDACFEEMAEVADQVLTLRRKHGPSIRIMAMTADIDAAFKQIAPTSCTAPLIWTLAGQAVQAILPCLPKQCGTHTIMGGYGSRTDTKTSIVSSELTTSSAWNQISTTVCISQGSTYARRWKWCLARPVGKKRSLKHGRQPEPHWESYGTRATAQLRCRSQN